MEVGEEFLCKFNGGERVCKCLFDRDKYPLGEPICFFLQWPAGASGEAWCIFGYKEVTIGTSLIGGIWKENNIWG